MSEAIDEGMSPDHVRQLIEAARQEAAELVEASASPKPPPDAVPGFEIIGEIGRGGMGVVYRAVQLSTKRVVALKVMLAGAFASRSAQRRFQREVELAARFRHPGIVRVLEGDRTSTGQPYYAMDYVQGVHLDRWLSTSQPDVHTTLRLFVDICEAVEHAHQNRVVHRDLKPANVVIDADGKPHILDFGLSKDTDQTSAEDTPSTVLSIPGQVTGTLRYLSPEQAAGTPAEVDPRTDVHALGVMLFEALTGALPFDSAGSPSDVMQRIREDPPARPSSLSSHVDGELETIILKALEKEKQRRYQSVTEFREDLGRYLCDELPLARRPSSFYVFRKRVSRHRIAFGVATVAVVLGLVGSFGAIWWRQHGLAEARWSALRIQRDLEAGRVQRTLGSAEVVFQKYPGLLEARLVSAQSKFRAGVIDTPSSILDQATGGPSHWAFSALLADIYRVTGDSRAEQMQAQADRDAPDTAEAWYLRTFTTLDIGRALSYAGEAVNREPGERLAPLAWERLAYLYVQTEDFEGALGAARKLIDLRDNATDWMMFEAEILVRLSRYEEAIEQCSRIISLDPTRCAPYRCRALAYLCRREYTNAIEDYSKAVELHGPYMLWQLYRRATPLWIAGRTEEAAADYREFRTLRGQVTRADARLFLVLCDGGEPDKAAQVLKAARRNVKNDPWLKMILECLAGERTPDQLADAADHMDLEQVCEAYYYAGEACRLEGRIEVARAWFQKCMDTNLVFDRDESPPDPKPEYHLARWRLRQLADNTGATPRPEGS